MSAQDRSLRASRGLDRGRSALLCTALGIAALGCAGPFPNRAEPFPNRQGAEAGAVAARETVLLGAFIAPVLQHPILEPEQRYFRPASQADAEWIAIVPRPLLEGLRLDVPIRVTGRVEVVDLGGPPGTRSAYRGTLIRVRQIGSPE